MPGRGSFRAHVARLVPGLLTAAAAVAGAFLVHGLLPALPAMTMAVVLGVLAANLPVQPVNIGPHSNPEQLGGMPTGNGPGGVRLGIARRLIA